MGAHVWLPAYVKRSLLPHLRITGWTPDWYDGFPALTFYFPLPIVAIAVASYAIPYVISFKLITVIGPAHPAHRRLGVRPAGTHAASPARLFLPWRPSRTCSAGSTPSTAATSLRRWPASSASPYRCRWRCCSSASSLEASRTAGTAPSPQWCSPAVGVSHILPLFFSIGGAIVLMAMNLSQSGSGAAAMGDPGARGRWGADRLLGPTVLVPPPYATNMGYGKFTDYSASLTSGGRDNWLILVAMIAFLISLAAQPGGNLLRDHGGAVRADVS